MIWWDSEKNVPVLTGIILLIILMLGVSASGYDLEIKTDALLKMRLPRTGWNQYYAKSGRKYAHSLTVKKKVETLSNPVKPRQNDVTKIFASASEVQMLRREIQMRRNK